MPRKPAAPPDPLAALAAKAGPKDPRPDAAAPRDTILLDDPAVAEAAATLLAALHAAKVIERHKAAALAVVVPYLRRRVVERWAAAGRKGPNPGVLVGTAGSFNFLVKDTCARFRMPPAGSPGTRPEMAEHLSDCGVPEDLAELLRTRAEYQEEVALSIDLDALRRDRPDLYERLAKLLAAAVYGGLLDGDGTRHKFSDADLAVVVRSERRVVIAEGFLSRAPALARETARPPGVAGDGDAADRLDALLAAIPPQWAVDSPVCADPDAAALGLLRRGPPTPT